MIYSFFREIKSIIKKMFPNNLQWWIEHLLLNKYNNTIKIVALKQQFKETIGPQAYIS